MLKCCKISSDFQKSASIKAEKETSNVYYKGLNLHFYRKYFYRAWISSRASGALLRGPVRDPGALRPGDVVAVRARDPEPLRDVADEGADLVARAAGDLSGDYP